MESLTIREMEQRDVAHILNYWASASPQHLDAMGVDPRKMIAPEELKQRLSDSLSVPAREKKTCIVIWEVNDTPIGFNSLAEIDFGNEAKIHLHIWEEKYRAKGFGTKFMKKALAYYMAKFKLKRIVCETKSTNPGPNKLFSDLGIKPSRIYRSVASPVMYETEVARYEINQADVSKLEEI